MAMFVKVYDSNKIDSLFLIKLFNSFYYYYYYYRISVNDVTLLISVFFIIKSKY